MLEAIDELEKERFTRNMVGNLQNKHGLFGIIFF